jgi:Domain of unknown function (DUF5655)/Domain of unknown function (DUF4287)
MDKALETQLANIQKRSGKTLDQLTALVKNSGLEKHGEMVAMLKTTLGMGHGDANTLVHYSKGHPSFADSPAIASGATAGGNDALLVAIYTGPKAALRPIHDAVMAQVAKFGEFEIAPKKTYLSLRRKKQFAMVGPATNTRVEVGLNMKDVKGTARLEALPPGGMCQYRVKLTSPADVDAELLGWIRRAYDAAG